MPSAAQAQAFLPTKFCLPDLVSHCSLPARLNRHHKQACAEADRWFIRRAGFAGKKKNAFITARPTFLSTRCYPLAAYPQMRVICDCLSWFFYIDDVSDEMSSLSASELAADVMNTLWHTKNYEPRSQVARMCRDYWRRMVQTASPVVQERFRESLDSYLQAATEQAIGRETGVIPDPDSYISLRRDTGGLKLCWVLIQYARNLNIPDEVMEHPAVKDIGITANDIVVFSNDLYSYNVEQSKGDDHNFLAVLMKHHGMDLQSASDEIGEVVKLRVNRFMAQRAAIPSWGKDVDKQIAAYIDGLASWISGNFAWSFESERYFGKANKEVKKTRVVDLLPRT